MSSRRGPSMPPLQDSALHDLIDFSRRAEASMPPHQQRIHPSKLSVNNSPRRPQSGRGSSNTKVLYSPVSPPTSMRGGGVGGPTRGTPGRPQSVRTRKQLETLSTPMREKGVAPASVSSSPPTQQPSSPKSNQQSPRGDKPPPSPRKAAKDESPSSATKASATINGGTMFASQTTTGRRASVVRDPAANDPGRHELLEQFMSTRDSEKEAAAAAAAEEAALAAETAREGSNFQHLRNVRNASAGGRSLGNMVGVSDDSKQIKRKYNEIHDACQHFQLSADLALLDMGNPMGKDVVQDRKTFLDKTDIPNVSAADVLDQLLDKISDPNNRFSKSEIEHLAIEEDIDALLLIEEQRAAMAAQQQADGGTAVEEDSLRQQHHHPPEDGVSVGEVSKAGSPSDDADPSNSSASFDIRLGPALSSTLAPQEVERGPPATTVQAVVVSPLSQTHLATARGDADSKTSTPNESGAANAAEKNTKPKLQSPPSVGLDQSLNTNSPPDAGFSNSNQTVAERRQARIRMRKDGAVYAFSPEDKGGRNASNKRMSLLQPKNAKVVQFHDKQKKNAKAIDGRQVPKPLRGRKSLGSSLSPRSRVAESFDDEEAPPISDTDSDDCAQQERLIWSELLDAQSATQHVLQLTRLSDIPLLFKHKKSAACSLETIFKAIRFLCKSMVVSLHNATDAYGAQQYELKALQERVKKMEDSNGGNTGLYGQRMSLGRNVGLSTSKDGHATGSPTSSDKPKTIEVEYFFLVTIAWDRMHSLSVECPAKDVEKAKSLFRTFVQQTALRASGHLVRESEDGSVFQVTFPRAIEALSWERCVQKYAMYLPWPKKLLDSPWASEIEATKEDIEHTNNAHQKIVNDYKKLAPASKMSLSVAPTLPNGSASQSPSSSTIGHPIQPSSTPRSMGREKGGIPNDVLRDSQQATTTISTIETTFLSYIQLANSEAAKDAKAALTGLLAAKQERKQKTKEEAKRRRSSSTSTGDGSKKSVFLDLGGNVSVEGGSGSDDDVMSAKGSNSDEEEDEFPVMPDVVNHATLLLLSGTTGGGAGNTSSGSGGGGMNFIDSLELSASAFTAPKINQPKVFSVRGPRLKSSIHFGSPVLEMARGKFNVNSFAMVASCLCGVAPPGTTVLSKPALNEITGPVLDHAFNARHISDKICDMLAFPGVQALSFYPELTSLTECGESIVTFVDWVAIPGRGSHTGLSPLLNHGSSETSGHSVTTTGQPSPSAHKDRSGSPGLGATVRLLNGSLTTQATSAAFDLGATASFDGTFNSSIATFNSSTHHDKRTKVINLTKGAAPSSQYNNLHEECLARRPEFDPNWWLRSVPCFATYADVSDFVGSKLSKAPASCRATQTDEKMLSMSGGHGGLGGPKKSMRSRSFRRTSQSFRIMAPQQLKPAQSQARLHVPGGLSDSGGESGGEKPNQSKPTPAKPTSPQSTNLLGSLTSPPQQRRPSATPGSGRRRSTKRGSIHPGHGDLTFHLPGSDQRAVPVGVNADTVDTGVQASDEQSQDMKGVTNWVLQATRLMCLWTEGGCDENDVLRQLYKAMHIPDQVDNDGDALAPQWEFAIQKFDTVVAGRKGVSYGEDAAVLRAGVAGNFIAIKELMEELKLLRASRRRGSSMNPMMGNGSGANVMVLSPDGTTGAPPPGMQPAVMRTGIGFTQSAPTVLGGNGGAPTSEGPSLLGSRRGSAAGGAGVPKRARRSSVMRVTLEGLDTAGQASRNTAASPDESNVPSATANGMLGPQGISLDAPPERRSPNQLGSPNSGDESVSTFESPARAVRAALDATAPRDEMTNQRGSNDLQKYVLPVNLTLDLPEPSAAAPATSNNANVSTRYDGSRGGRDGGGSFDINSISSMPAAGTRSSDDTAENSSQQQPKEAYVDSSADGGNNNTSFSDTTTRDDGPPVINVLAASSNNP